VAAASTASEHNTTPATTNCNMLTEWLQQTAMRINPQVVPIRRLVYNLHDNRGCSNNAQLFQNNGTDGGVARRRECSAENQQCNTFHQRLGAGRILRSSTSTSLNVETTSSAPTLSVPALLLPDQPDRRLFAWDFCPFLVRLLKREPALRGAPHFIADEPSNVWALLCSRSMSKLQGPRSK
jgi:hypothetical protein